MNSKHAADRNKQQEHSRQEQQARSRRERQAHSIQEHQAGSGQEQRATLNPTSGPGDVAMEKLMSSGRWITAEWLIVTVNISTTQLQHGAKRSLNNNWICYTLYVNMSDVKSCQGSTLWDINSKWSGSTVCWDSCIEKCSLYKSPALSSCLFQRDCCHPVSDWENYFFF